MSDDIQIPARRPLTLRDVSEASGVSEMTVSRVLRNRGDVSDATQEKVLKVIIGAEKIDAGGSSAFIRLQFSIKPGPGKTPVSANSWNG